MEHLIEKNNSYTLSQSFLLHSAAVRSVDYQNEYLVSGSMDKTVNVYKYNSNKYEQINSINFCQDYIGSVKALKNGLGFIIACKDTNIYVVDNEGNPLFSLEGHKGWVCSLSLLSENILVSGSWDATAKIWNLSSKNCLNTLEGHSFAVCVLAINNTIITGNRIIYYIFYLFLLIFLHFK